MEKNEEIIKPIEKQVKRPVMKFISKIATPLAVLIIAIWGIFICNYYQIFVITKAKGFPCGKP